VFNAPFDSVNTLDTVKRDVKAVFAEVLVPITKQLELTVAARHDDYTGFGGTNNPKVSLRFTPISNLVLRASYNTGFRVPTFSQLFFGVTESQYVGKDLVDPAKCPGGKVDATKAGCESITPNTLFGGKPDLGPEESKQWTGGFVWAPSNNFSVGADLWSIRRTGTVQSLSLTDLVANYTLFPNNFIRDTAGNLTFIDQRWVNAGETITKGIDINARAGGRVGPGSWGVLLEGSYLLEKKSRLIASAPMGASEIGVFTRTGDLGLRWKHSITGSYVQGPWNATLTQLYRSGYKDAVLPGVANGSVTPPDWTPNVSAYTLYNMSVGYTGIKNLGLTFGIKNLFDKDPPFSAVYDTNTGAGSSWEPRVADPRGRSFTFTVDYKFY
jgi:iron complex outermembrane receptor protein